MIANGRNSTTADRKHIFTLTVTNAMRESGQSTLAEEGTHETTVHISQLESPFSCRVDE